MTNTQPPTWARDENGKRHREMCRTDPPGAQLEVVDRLEAGFLHTFFKLGRFGLLFRWSGEDWVRTTYEIPEKTVIHIHPQSSKESTA